MTTFLSCVTALAALAAAILTAVYVRLTYRLLLATQDNVEQAARQTRANLLNTILEEFGSKALGEAMRELRRWKEEHGNAWLKDFENALKSPDARNTDAYSLDITSRRLVSHFFSKIHAFCQHELLEAKVVGRSVHFTLEGLEQVFGPSLQ